MASEQDTARKVNSVCTRRLLYASHFHRQDANKDVEAAHLRFATPAAVAHPRPHLTPDTATSTTPNGFRDVLKASPSIQRRSRLLESAFHFSRVAPLPLEFPYRIEPPEEGKEVEDKEAYVENWLATHEPLEERTLAPTPSPGVLKKYSCAKRDGTKRILIGLSDTCLRDCFPHLAVGDAFVELDTPTLSMKDPGGNELLETPKRKVAGDQAAVREELVDVLSGLSVLMSIDGAEPGYTPWSLRYSGHQFGSWRVN